MKHYDISSDESGKARLLDRAPDEDSDREDLEDSLQSPSLLTRFHPRIWVFTTIIQTLIIFLLAIFLVIARHQLDPSPFTIRHRFGYERPYMSLDHAYDHLWNETNHSALVYSEVNGSVDVGGIAMFHQLHCLASLRKALQNAREGIEIGMDQTDDHHWPHCMAYLQKAILCFADDTIEYRDVVDGVQMPRISGSQTPRKCRDSQILYDLRKENHYENPDQMSLAANDTAE